MSPIKERFDLFDWLVKGVGSIVGLVAPTYALVRLGKLPELIEDTAQIVLPVLTAAMIVIIIILGKQIGALSGKAAASLVVALAVTGALTTVTYSMFTFEQVVGIEYMKGETVQHVEREVKPLNPTKDIRHIVGEDGDYREALLRSKGETLRTLMREQNFSAIALIWVMMMVAQLTMVAACVGGAWWLAEQEGSNTPPRGIPSESGSSPTDAGKTSLPLG